MNTKASQAWARSLVARAVQAPSSHNTQPWRFRVSPGAIDLHADRGRSLPANDPDDRELAISCGCALLNLRIAAAAEGLDGQLELLPDPGRPDWLAHLAVTGRAPGPPEDAALSAFIEQRRTCRSAFLDRPVAAAVPAELMAAAEREGAWLRPLAAAATRREAADLVAAGDARQWANPAWRRELAAWLQPRHRGEGLTVPALVAPLARLVVRTLDLGHRVGAQDRKLALAAPLLAVLGTGGDEPRDWLQAGQALQRVLLVACRHGLQASYLNQPVQVATLRPRLGGLAGGGHPQILLRLGYPAGPVPAAPRRGLFAVMDSGADTPGAP